MDRAKPEGRHVTAPLRAIDHIDGNSCALHAGQELAFLERDTEPLVRAQQLRINLIERPRPVPWRVHRLGRRVVMEVLEVDLWVSHIGPGRLRHRLPALQRIEPPLQHPCWLGLLIRDEADRVLVQALLGDSMLVSKPYLY